MLRLFSKPLRCFQKSSTKKINFDLDGCKLELALPPHFVNLNYEQSEQNISIYDSDKYEPWIDSTGMSRRLFLTGWTEEVGLFNRSEIGTLLLRIYLIRKDPNFRNSESLFEATSYSNWILDRCRREWGKVNNSLWDDRESYDPPIDKNRDFWVYPTKPSELSSLNDNGIEWLNYLIKMNSEVREYHWHTPISDDHEIELFFELDTETSSQSEAGREFRGLCEEAIKTCISNVKLTLSNNAQEQKDLAQAAG